MDYGQTTEIVNWYETEEYMDACQLMHDWYEKGYVSADQATCTDAGEALMRAGNLFSFLPPETKYQGRKRLYDRL